MLIILSNRLWKKNQIMMKLQGLRIDLRRLKDKVILHYYLIKGNNLFPLLVVVRVWNRGVKKKDSQRSEERV
jgi:hypothetical protein